MRSILEGSCSLAGANQAETSMLPVIVSQSAIDSRQKLKVAGLMAFLLMCISLYLAQVLSGNNALWFSHWIVQDGIHLFNGLLGVIPDCPDSCLGRGAGTYLVHSLPYKLMGVVGFFVLNMLLVLWIVLRHGLSLFFLFPVYLFSLALPSKDLLMLVLILEWSWFLERKGWVPVLLLLGLMYMFRDGNMFSSLACTIAILLWRIGFSWRWLALASLAFCGVMFVYGAQLLMHIPVYSSYVGVYHSVSRLEVGSFADYMIRLVGNSTNIAMRTVFVDNHGGISLLAVVGVVSGVSMLAAFVFVVWSFIRNDGRHRVVFAGLMLLVAWAVLSVNPLVQPRYLMPYSVAFFMLVPAQYSRKEQRLVWTVTLAVTVLGIILYGVLPIPHPPVPIVHEFMLY